MIFDETFDDLFGENFGNDEDSLPKYTAGLFIAAIIAEGAYGIATGVWGSTKLVIVLFATIVMGVFSFCLLSNFFGRIARGLFKTLLYSLVFALAGCAAGFIIIKTGIMRELLGNTFKPIPILKISVSCAFLFAVISEIQIAIADTRNVASQENDDGDDDEEDDSESDYEEEDDDSEEEYDDDDSDDDDNEEEYDDSDDDDSEEECYIPEDLRNGLEEIDFHEYNDSSNILVKDINDKFGLCVCEDESEEHNLCLGFVHFNETNFSSKQKSRIRELLDRREYAALLSEDYCDFGDEWLCKRILCDLDDDETLETLFQKINLLEMTAQDI